MGVKKSIAHERRISAYLPVKYHKLLTAYCETTGETKSTAMVDAVRMFFEIRVGHIPKLDTTKK